MSAIVSIKDDLSMSFVYTKHANMRMRERNLLPSQIEQAVLQPDNVIPSFKGRLLARKEFLGNILEVAYRWEKESYIILTAYWLEEVPDED